MAGIYIHIPFCQQACHYCDFHFSTNLSLIDEMIESLGKELKLRKDYLAEPIETIYFGGGTPSLVDPVQIGFLLEQVREHFQVVHSPEITLEANPEDLDRIRLEKLLEINVNRLSIGIQTFSDDQLKWMNRIHNSNQSTQVVQKARDVGFENISLDLIYAIPHGNSLDHKENLHSIIKLDPEHVSIYGLTIEDKTVFGRSVREGKFKELDEDNAATQYLTTIEFLESNGYRQYEVSNFSKPRFESKHNASYWSGQHYLGIGPGAHSYDGKSRQFNVRNNARYLRAIQQEETYFDFEKLSNTQLMNERILTGLRTIDGIDLLSFSDSFGIDLIAHYQSTIIGLKEQEIIQLSHDHLKLTRKGFLVADEIALNLFFAE